MKKNLTPVFCLIAFIAFGIAATSVVPPIPLSWQILSLIANILAIVCSLLTLIYGTIEVVKYKRKKIQNIICIALIIMLWLWFLSIAF